MAESSTLIELTTDIVSAYAGNNRLTPEDLPALIQATYAALSGTLTPEAPAEEIKTPAVPIKKSIGQDYLICLEDGLKFKSLKRHLHSKYNLTPQAYRARWGLPKDYPMVAPGYSAQRSALAKQTGLGVGGRGGASKPAAVAEPVAASEPAPAPAPAVKAAPRKKTVKAKALEPAT